MSVGEAAPADVADAGPDARALQRQRLKVRAFGALQPLLPLITLCVIFAIINPEFLQGGNLRGIVEQNVVVMAAAVGATLVILMGAIDLSVEGVLLLGSVVVALLVQNSATTLDLGVVGVLAGCALGALFGLVSGVFNALGKIPSFAVTLGTWYIGVGLATVLLAQFAQAGVSITDPTIVGYAVNDKAGFSTLTIFAVGLVIIGYLIQRFTLLGRRAFAIGGNETVAGMSGVPVVRTKIAIFAFAGTVYGFAGFEAVARYGGMASGISSGAILFTVITAIVVGGTSLAGGRGGVLHTVVGVLTLGVLANGLVLSGVEPFYQQIVQGALIVIALSVGAWQTTMKTREIVK